MKTQPLPLILINALFLLSLNWGLSQGTISVNTTTDENTNNGNCSLREAIISANTNTDHRGCSRTGVAPYTINVPAGTYLLNLTGAFEDNCATGDLDLLADMTIDGTGESSTIIDGNFTDRVFEVGAGTGGNITANIQNLTVRDGSGNNGAGIRLLNSSSLNLSNVTVTNNSQTANGGGLRCESSSTITIVNCTFSNNTAGSDGSGSGGAISTANAVTVAVSNTTFSNNTAGNGGATSFSDGGAVSSSSATFNNCTFLSNSADGDGGGYSASGAGTRTFNNCTFSGNTANGNGGGIYATGTVNLNFVTLTANTADNDNNGSGNGGGVYNNSTLNINNCIVQGNNDKSTASADDCGGSAASGSSDYNVVGSGTGCPTGTNGTTGSANLAAIADNGGDTQTHLPQSGSAALDLIPDGTNGCGSGVGAVDQRGAIRPDVVGCEAGAVENSSALPVELITFHVKNRETGAVLLTWVTASEINNQGFEIEWANEVMMEQKAGWKVLGFEKGQGNISDAHTYYYDHPKPHPGINYYRLKQIDFDGQFEYSPIVSIEYTSHLSMMSIYPNPVSTGFFNVRLNDSREGEIHCAVYDYSGRCLHKQISSSNIISIDINGFKPGIYLIQVEKNGALFWEHFVVQ